MKKIRIILLSLCVISLLMVALVSCGSKLSTPSGLRLDVETQTLTWNAVKGAKFYTVQISGQDRDITTKTNQISLEDLDAGEYEIRIVANGDGESVDDSAAVVYNFTRERETGLKYQLINNDTEYELVGAGKASGDVVMEDYFRGKPVTSIADKALYHNTKITSFTVGNNVKTIGAKAFTKCAKLTEIVIPENVVSIGEYAFQSCKVLTKITLPDSVSVIAPYTFAWCSGLQEVTLGKNVLSIGEYAFSNCEVLTTMTYNGAPATAGKAVLPDSLLMIGIYAFADCSALTDMNIGNNVEYIAEYAFCNDAQLTKLDLGDKLLSIERFAFFGCSSLSSVSIPDSTKAIGDRVFYRCTSLSDVSLGAGLESIGTEVFNETAAFNAAGDMLIIDGWLIRVLNTTLERVSLTQDVRGIASYAFVGCSKLVQADFKGVKYVGTAALAQCASLYKVTFDSALLTLGDYALYGCPYLKDVALGTSLLTIGDYVFSECKTLELKSLPESLTSIGTRAFRNTASYNKTKKGNTVYVGDWAVDFYGSTATSTSLPPALVVQEGTRGIASYAFTGQVFLSCTIADSVEYIGRGAFYNVQVPSVKLPQSLKYIGDYAFYGCQVSNFGGYTFELVIPEGTEYIGRSAFYKCAYIVSLTVPDSVKTIGPYAFYSCPNIGATVKVQKPSGEKDESGQDVMEVVVVEGKLTLGEGLESIGERAFQNCIGLADVTIPDSVTYLGSRSFYKCTGLKTLSIGSGLSRIEDYTFYKCESLETVVLSDKLEQIGNYAFRGCAALKEITLPAVQSLGRYSFYGCASLTNIVLPKTLTEIGDYAFRGCNLVTAIALPDSIETIGKHVFYGLNDTTLYVASNAIKPYWNDKFNSSYRPIFWGCTLSEDGSYVISFTMNKDMLVNAAAKNGISNPIREGYVFLGWALDATSGTVAYGSDTVAQAPEGTELYAVWSEQTVDNQ